MFFLRRHAGGVPAIDFGGYNRRPANQPASFRDLFDHIDGNPGACWVSVKCYQAKWLVDTWSVRGGQSCGQNVLLCVSARLAPTMCFSRNIVFPRWPGSCRVCVGRPTSRRDATPAPRSLSLCPFCVAPAPPGRACSQAAHSLCCFPTSLPTPAGVSQLDCSRRHPGQRWQRPERLCRPAHPACQLHCVQRVAEPRPGRLVQLRALAPLRQAAAHPHGEGVRRTCGLLGGHALLRVT